MAWSGGTFTRAEGTTGWADDEAASIGIESGRHDTSDNDLAAGINACLNKDGSNAATAALNMGGFRLTALGNATALTDAAKVLQVQNGTYNFAGAGGSGAAYTLDLAPDLTAYAQGQVFWFFAFTNSSSTTPTLNVNGVGAKTIKRPDLSALAIADIVGGRTYCVAYDGTDFLLQNPTPQYVSWTPTVGISAGAVGSTSTTGVYKRDIENVVHFTLEFTTTVSGGGGLIDFTLPTTALNQHTNYVGSELIATAPNMAIGRHTSTTVVQLSRVGPISTLSWGDGTYTIRVSGSYPSA